MYPPDKFNPGVMVLKPCLGVMEDMLSKVSKLSSYDGRDTGEEGGVYCRENVGSVLPTRYSTNTRRRTGRL